MEQPKHKLIWAYNQTPKRARAVFWRKCLAASPLFLGMPTALGVLMSMDRTVRPVQTILATGGLLLFEGILLAVLSGLVSKYPLCYNVTDAGIFLAEPGRTLMLEYPHIRDIRVRHSRLFPGYGSIVFSLSRTMQYRFEDVKDPDAVCALILPLWKEARQA